MNRAALSATVWVEKQKSIGCWAEGATASEKSQEEEEDLSQAVYLIL